MHFSSVSMELYGKIFFIWKLYDKKFGHPGVTLG